MKPGYKLLFSIIGALLVVGIIYGATRLFNPAPAEAELASASAEDPAAGQPAEPEPEPEPQRPSFTLKLTDATATAIPPAIQHFATADVTGCLVDAADGRVLWHHRADELVPIASMTKLMTTIIALDEIERRDDLTLDTGVKITQAAMDIGGSQVYLGKDEVFTLRELLQAVMIHSANDCAYAVAEAVSPEFSVPRFVALMNRRARDFGLAKTRFFNVHGLPEATPERDCQSTANELVILGHHCMAYPKLMEWGSTWHHPFRPNAEEPLIMQNRNRLVNTCDGVNGLKTGYIKRSGFCVTVTCTRNGRTLIAAVTGFPSAKSRNSFVSGLLDWGYAR